MKHAKQTLSRWEASTPTSGIILIPSAVLGPPWVVCGNTRGEARAELKKLLYLSPGERLPVGIKFTKLDEKQESKT